MISEVICRYYTLACICILCVSTFARKPIDSELASPEVLTTAGLASLKFIHRSKPPQLTAISPWPNFTSLSVMSMLTGAVVLFYGIAPGGSLLSLGFISTVTAFIIWLRSFTTEMTKLGLQKRIVQSSLSLGISLFIVTEALFYRTSFWANYRSSLSPTF